jgi:RHS repeat-associated protein
MIKNGRTYRLVLDHLGSVRMVVDVADSTVAQRLEYDAFGRITLNSNPGFQPFAYAGGLFDEATRLTHFGARDYDADIGRWISKDPMLFAGNDANLYAYVANDPVNYRDPSGYEGTSAELSAAGTGRGILAASFDVTNLMERLVKLKMACALAQIGGAMLQDHHVVFEVFGGESTNDNFVTIPSEVHRVFHLVVNSMLKGVGEKTIIYGNKNWMADFQADPNKRETVKEVLLLAATVFDLMCQGMAVISKEDHTPTSMRQVMEAYFQRSDNW